MFNFIKRSIKRNFGIDKEYFRFIDDMFGFIPNNIELYKVALIHKSASQSVDGHHINNERLEYLGDAVIESITSEYLFIAYPDRDEGFLTQMRSKIVSRQSLNEMAVFIGLDKYLICKSGATLQQKHLYGDAFEAMMGAIYLDKGYDFTNRLLINDIFERFLSIDELSDSESDFKSRLIEWCQKNRHSLEFRTRKGGENKSGAPVFYTTVIIDGIETGHGVGDSKKSSEQNAAYSLVREMSDAECARLLDKVDRMLVKAENRKPKNEAPVKSQEPAAAETESPQHEPAAEEQPAKRRRGRRKKSAEHQAPAAESEAQSVETPVEEQPQEQPQEQPVKKRRGRKKKSEVAAEAAPAAAETVAEAPEQPVKKRRGRRKKSEIAAEAAPAAAETVAEVPEQPVKKRRGRRKKSESAAAELPAENGEQK